MGLGWIWFVLKCSKPDLFGFIGNANCNPRKKMTVALIVATDSRSGCSCVLLSKLTTKITEWLTLEETCKGHLVQPPSTHGTHALMYVQFI